MAELEIKLNLIDCDLGVRQYQAWGSGGIELFLELPKRIDLTGIESFRQFPGGHDQWRNSQGTLYIACDKQARYWPKEEKHDPASNGFEFKSEGNWFDHKRKGKRFILRKLDRYFRDVLGETDKDRIIEAVQKSDILSGFLQSFLGWVNEFAAQYGEQHFYVP